MLANSLHDSIVSCGDTVLVTGATGFIGARVVGCLLSAGISHVRCLVRPTADLRRLNEAIERSRGRSRTEFVVGNLLSLDDCLAATRNATVIYHLAVGGSTKSFADAFLNSVVTTRNLLEAARLCDAFRRFVNVSSFAVYTNRNKPSGRMLDEDCPLEDQPQRRGDAYCFAKVEQENLVEEYGREHAIPFVTIRPGVVYGPEKPSLVGRIGTDTFGIFLHMGGGNKVPLTYVENCADAIVLAGLRKGIDGEVFNIVDDDLPSSRQILRGYKRNVTRFTSIYIPHGVGYLLHYLWETYSDWSEGQLPPTFNRWTWHAFWKRTDYTNAKLKKMLEWTQRTPTPEGLQRYFLACRKEIASA